MADSRKNWWERCEDSLRARSWLQLRDMWVSCSLGDHAPGTLPSTGVEESLELRTQALIVKALDENPQRTYLDDIPGVRSGVLLEGIALLHKAANVATAGQNDFEVGFRSWSVSTCYHASYFAMRSLCCLLGMVVVSIDGSTYVIDVCAEEKKHKAGRPKKELIYRAASGQATHQALWYLFQRLLRVTAVPAEIWPPEWAGALKRLDASDFARQRNDIHYQSNSWPFADDLRALAPIVTHGTFGGKVCEALDDADRDDFTVALSFVLLRMASQLLSDLAVDLSVVEREAGLLFDWQDVAQNSHYRAEFPR